jgi:hypothetical protein
LAIGGALAMGSPAAAAPTGSQIVTVTEDDPSWAEQAYECTDTGSYLTPQQASVAGPQRTPFGLGSHRFTINEYTVQTELYRTADYDGMALADLTRLQYSTYAAAQGAGPDRQPAYLRLTVDTDSDDVSDTSLFFFPANNADQHPIVNGAWQTWDVASGHLSIDGDSGPTSTVTLADFVADHPEATLVNNGDGSASGGALALITGCGMGGDSDTQRNGTYYVDRVIVGDAGADTLYDFEGPTESDGGTTEKTVSPGHTSPWVSQAYDYVTDRDLQTTQAYVAGPSPAPNGRGSLRMTLSDDSNPNRIEQFRTAAYDGMLLRDIRGLSYSTYESADPGNGNLQQPVYLFLRIDNDHDGSWDDVLFYYPGNNAPVANGAWQTWDAANGRWNLNGDDGAGNAFGLESYLVQHPDARIVNSQAGTASGGGVTFQAGAGGDGQLNGSYFLDDITIRTVDQEDPATVGGKVYDLEPTVPEPAASISDASAVEGNTGETPATFVVSLSEPTLVPVTLSYHTEGRSAQAGSDYGSVSGTLTFEPGQTSKTVDVAVLGDKAPEPVERFSVVLDNATNATIADGTGVGRIVNDDTAVDVSASRAAQRHVRVAVSTHPHAANAPLQIMRAQRGADAVLFEGTLDDDGRFAALLAQQFRSGSTVRLYAKVVTGSGTYRSDISTVTIG